VQAALRALILVVAALVGAAAAQARGGPAGTPGEWQQFGYDSAHHGVNPRETTIQPGNVATLHLLYRVSLPGLVNSAPVFLSSVATSAGLLDLLFMTTADGRVLAVDAATGRTVWSRRPATGPGITASAPAIDPGRQLVYSYGLDGRVHRYRVGDGHEMTGGGWPEVATLKPQVEKCSPALAVAAAANGRHYLYVTHGGALAADQGDYQGHVTAVDLDTGAQRVWNADCSDQPVHFTTGTPDCPAVQSAVWGRGGVVYDSDLDRIFFSTGNGAFDVPQGGHDWGDSVLELRPDGSANGALPLDSYTPASFQQLDDDDLDLGSTEPALLPALAASRYPHLGLQSGKDGLIRLLDLDDLSGRGRPGQVGGELQTIPVPQGGEVLTAPAIWVDPESGVPWVFLANGSGISGLQLIADAGGTPSLLPVWTRRGGGTSPVVAGGVVFYVGRLGLQALSPASGAVLWHDALPGKAGIHWQSPIVIDGRVYVADQGSNLWAYAPTAPSTCTADAATLCLQNGRFQVRTTWQTAGGATGDGQALALTADTGAFWFFAAGNLEMVVKVLNGCATDGRYWVFAGGLTDTNVVMTVTDTATGAVRVYVNPQGVAFAPIQDTRAFSSCP
jgi:outer membrane protein assembly factor BamB